MKMAKREVLQEIHNLLMHNYGHETGGTMFLYMMQKCQGVNYGDSNRILGEDLRFLRNLTRSR